LGFCFGDHFGCCAVEVALQRLQNFANLLFGSAVVTVVVVFANKYGTFHLGETNSMDAVQLLQIE